MKEKFNREEDAYVQAVFTAANRSIGLTILKHFSFVFPICLFLYAGLVSNKNEWIWISVSLLVISHLIYAYYSFKYSKILKGIFMKLIDELN
ncbi:hypothetical protein VDG1235_2190 [Verrucomicrobiia bacterium DG1235]|nr:hypothetical protein VDG1235_2190 [Verrucomicrobiae bacterium DG1235]